MKLFTTNGVWIKAFGKLNAVFLNTAWLNTV